MIQVLLQLEDLVLADFGSADLASVRRFMQEGAHEGGRPLEAKAKLFLDILARVQRRDFAVIYVWAGRRLTEVLLKERPAVFRSGVSTRTVLLQLNQIVGACLEELLPHAPMPEFYQEFLDGLTIRVGFDGPIEVAWLLEGMMSALAGRFNEQVVTARADAPGNLPDRQLVDVKVVPDRRANRVRSGLSPVGVLR